MKKVAIVWFRRDLRLADNPALSAALEYNYDAIVPVFIQSLEELEPWAPGGAQRVWLHFSLTALDSDLRAIGSRLIIRQGDTLDELNNLIQESGATAVYWNRLYDPQEITRDKHIKSLLKADGIDANSFNAALLHEPWQLSTGQGEPYKVFTPYWKKACNIEIPTLLAVPDKLPAVPQNINSLQVSDLDLLPHISWDQTIRDTWNPGERGAHERLNVFFEDVLANYAETRDQPSVPGTSYLSPHLHFGEIGPRQIMQRLNEWLYYNNSAICERHADRFRSEIGWREFAHHVLYHFPDTPEQPLNERFKEFPWANP
ncbi:MAG TPA: deoxyribodipyrimidine photo-lyase, partial [Gammaproteobacteria bacterium]|nr:deoxyribodipyrimidine photo-lyase [Gammaproteobacteria bacterium]